jgi:organic radical activating enzyme
MAAAPVHEVFASLQGEGAFAGQPQVFLRLDGCPLRCAWCDTPRTWSAPPADAASPDGEHGARRAWLEAGEAAALVERVDPGGSRPVSLTGGEPLMWPAFALALREALPARRRLHLETAGAFPGALAEVLPAVQHASVDLKLPLDLAAPVPLAVAGHAFEEAPGDASEWRTARRAVLGLLAGRDACLKLVVAGGRTAAEYAELLADAADRALDLPLYLTPATPTRQVVAPAPELVEAVAEEALARGLSVRVLPQLHPLLGLR